MRAWRISFPLGTSPACPVAGPIVESLKLEKTLKIEFSHKLRVVDPSTAAPHRTGALCQGFWLWGDLTGSTGGLHQPWGDFTESWNGLGWKGPLKAIQSNPLQWAGTSSTTSGCSEPHPTWPWMFPGMGHRPPLWATCARVSPPSS